MPIPLLLAAGLFAAGPESPAANIPSPVHAAALMAVNDSTAPSLAAPTQRRVLRRQMLARRLVAPGQPQRRAPAPAR